MPEHMLMLPEAHPSFPSPWSGKSRRFARVPLVVRGINSGEERFRERTRTNMIQAQGGMLYLNESVEIDVTLILSNPETEEEQECRVNFLGEVCRQGQR